jgi:uncharacterized protein
VKRLRVVLDTNVVISALLLAGRASCLVDKWKSGSIILLATKEIIREYLRVLAYPKFELKDTEIETLLDQEILPYVETVKTKSPFSATSRDPDDDKFLACAVAAKADFIVSGDDDLLTLKRIGKCPIISLDEFLKTALF